MRSASYYDASRISRSMVSASCCRRRHRRIVIVVVVVVIVVFVVVVVVVAAILSSPPAGPDPLSVLRHRKYVKTAFASANFSLSSSPVTASVPPCLYHSTWFRVCLFFAICLLISLARSVCFIFFSICLSICEFICPSIFLFASVSFGFSLFFPFLFSYS